MVSNQGNGSGGMAEAPRVGGVMPKGRDRPSGRGNIAIGKERRKDAGRIKGRSRLTWPASSGRMASPAPHGDTFMAKKKISAVVTEYRKWSHAEVIVGKVLEGYNHDGKDGPDMHLVSMVVDQTPAKDLSKDL